MSELPRDRPILVLASHRYACDEFVRAGVAVDGSRLATRRSTPNQLAARLAAPTLASRGLTIASRLCLGAVVGRVIHQLSAAGHLGRFAAIADRPGFSQAVQRTFEELRLSCAEISALDALQTTDSDLACLLCAIECELAALNLADRACVLTEATHSLAASIDQGAALILLDLELAFEAERRFIGSLVQGATDCCATVPAADSGFAPEFVRSLSFKTTYLRAPEVSSLDRLQVHLFEETMAEGYRELDASVSVASWSGEARECIEIVRRMQAKASEGVPFDRMAVFLRTPDVYRPYLTEALRRGGIPAWFAQGATRPDPAGRALLALLACATENLSARRFAEYLSLAQVPEHECQSPQWALPDHDLMLTRGVAEAPEVAVDTAQSRDCDGDATPGRGRSPWRWERLIIEASVIGGQERWLRRLDGLAAEFSLRRAAFAIDDVRVAALDRGLDDLSQLKRFALPLIERLANLPAESTWGKWLSILRDLAAAALKQPSAVLAILTELEPLAPVSGVDLSAVRLALTSRLDDLTDLPEVRPYGSVFVGPVEMARGLQFDAVFVPGLAEKLFPQRLLEDALLQDDARSSLHLDLSTQESRVASERLKLRLAAGAAVEHLAVSWPRFDLKDARARVPSFYALEVMRAAEGRLPGFDDLKARAERGCAAQLDCPTAEEPERSIDDTEYDLAVLARLRDLDAEGSAGAAVYLLNANPTLARALRARGRRWLNFWNASDGLVDPDEEALAVLGRYRLDAYPHSPTGLEHFASCPYKFLLHTVHGLRARDQTETLDVMDPATRGALIHEVQYELLCLLREKGMLPIQLGTISASFDLLDHVLSNIGAKYYEKLAPAIPRVWEDGLDTIRFDLREWLRRAADDQQWIPHLFEMRFGQSAGPQASSDPSSVAVAVRVLDNWLLRGSIDLVERQADGVLRVTDHKTGAPHVPAEAITWGGRALQPLLYALAAEAILGAPVQAGRLYYCTAEAAFAVQEVRLDDASRQDVQRALGVIDHALEKGFLPAAPLPGACFQCDYRVVCGPLEEFRTGRKRGEQLDGLRQLRGLK